MILIVCALLPELRYLSQRADIDIVASGVGPVEAALVTARALASKPYDAVINAGIGGAFRGRARVGDAVLVEAEWLADFGLEGGGEPALPAGARLIERERADAGLIAAVGSLGLAFDTGLTVAQVTTTDATAERLWLRYGAGIESMEGFAVLRAAAAAGVPALELRGVSNYVGARAKSAWDFAAGAQATARALEAVLSKLAE